MRKKTRAGLFRIVRLVLTENTAESPEHSLISLERANWGAQPHYSYRRRLSMVDRDDSRCALAPSGPPPLRDGVVSHLRCSARTRCGSSPAHAHQHKSPLTGAFCIGGEAGIRTLGALRLNGFQDRRFRPLSHLSSAATGYRNLARFDQRKTLIYPCFSSCCFWPG